MKEVKEQRGKNKYLTFEEIIYFKRMCLYTSKCQDKFLSLDSLLCELSFLRPNNRGQLSKLLTRTIYTTWTLSLSA